MIGVDRIEDMRRRARGGEPIASIARAVGVSEPTARKYARMEDLSPEPPKRKEPESELLAPHRETTGSWPGDDCRNWRKQRHTAVRVYVRLINERGYEGSYSTVQRYVKQRREEMARERVLMARCSLTTRWLPRSSTAYVKLHITCLMRSGSLCKARGRARRPGAICACAGFA